MIDLNKLIAEAMKERVTHERLNREFGANDPRTVASQRREMQLWITVGRTADEVLDVINTYQP